MQPRRPSRSSVLPALLCAAALGLWGCGPPDGAEVTPEVVAGCEAASDELRKTNQNMLPGRVCEGCHRAGGQASNSPFTLSGTVFATKNSGCNAGGLNGRTMNLFVEVQDDKGVTQPNGVIPVNEKGNFYTAFSFRPPLKIVLYTKDAAGVKTKETVMNTLVGYGVAGSGGAAVGCATCHQNPGANGASGRVYFPGM